MIVPEFWADARIHQKLPDRQITVRRSGWSDVSQEDAQQHAEQRAREAFDRIIRGEQLTRREKKVGYNGADGLPIREEIIDRVGGCVVTRNSYGARCLNTPHVFFADIDYPGPITGKCSVILGGIFLGIATSIVLLFVLSNRTIAGVSAALSFILISTTFPLFVDMIYRLSIRLRGGADQIITSRIKRFVTLHPGWHLRIYQSPNGYRLLAMHQTFDPPSKTVKNAFLQLEVDPTYAIMCQKQNCFRARLTGKPWRMGFESGVSLNRGVWPIAEARRSHRDRWVAEYEAAAVDYSACRFLKAIGAVDVVCEEARAACEIHDTICKASENLPMA